MLGPLPPAPDWSAPRAAADKAWRLAQSVFGAEGGCEGRQCEAFDAALEKAYAHWANMAEEELCDYAGVMVAKAGQRALRPRLVWRPIVPEQVPNSGAPPPAAAVLDWLRGIATEAVRATSILASAANGEDIGHQVNAEDERELDMPADDDLPMGDLADDGSYDEVDFDDALLDDIADGDDPALRPGRSRRPTSTSEGCRRILRELAPSLADDIPGGEVPSEVATWYQSLKEVLIEVAQAADDRGGQTSLEASTQGWCTFATRLTSILNDIKDELDKVEAQVDKAERDAWKAWVREGINAGASNAHAFSRIPTEQVLQSAVDASGSFSCAPVALLGEQHGKFSAMWKPARGPYRYDWRGSTALPRASAAALREAAKSFSWQSASTYDGLHPRQLANLSDEALDVLATLLAIAELSGQLAPSSQSCCHGDAAKTERRFSAHRAFACDIQTVGPLEEGGGRQVGSGSPKTFLRGGGGERPPRYALEAHREARSRRRPGPGSGYYRGGLGRLLRGARPR